MLFKIDVGTLSIYEIKANMQKTNSFFLHNIYTLISGFEKSDS